MVKPGRPMQGQDMLDVGEVAVRIGRVERAFLAAVEAAQACETLEAADAGLAALAVELARACDVASRKQDPYGVAAAGRELREVASRLKLDPSARGASTGGSLDDFLRDLASPDAGTVRDTTNT